MMTSIPKGSIPGCSDIIHRPIPNLDTAYAEQNSDPTKPAPDEIE
jgi:hypothetical protein